MNHHHNNNSFVGKELKGTLYTHTRTQTQKKGLKENKTNADTTLF